MSFIFPLELKDVFRFFYIQEVKKIILFYTTRNVENWFYDSLQVLLTPTNVQ